MGNEEVYNEYISSLTILTISKKYELERNN